MEERIVNEALLDAFRHNAWTTKQLLEFCRDLSAEKLTAPGVGTYGGILEIFNHIVLREVSERENERFDVAGIVGEATRP